MTRADLEAVLHVQERDTNLDRLRHRRAALPERALLHAAVAELAQRRRERADVDARRAQVTAEERRLDDEVRTVRAHAEEVDARLYSGAVTSPRELQAMQDDVEMLRRRQSELEDDELVVMEEREQLDGELAVLDGAIAVLDARRAELEATIAGVEQEIDDEIAQELTGREQLAAPIPDALVRDYERRRAQNKGAGAARLVGVTCQACHLTIPSTEAERIRRADGAEVAYCDNCGAILVP